MNKSKSSRRNFLRNTGLALAATAAPPISFPIKVKAETAAYKYPNPGKIAIVYNPNATNGYNNVNFDVVQAMFDQGIMQFTGITSSPANALASFFPGLTTSKKIAIKPNLINSSVPTRKELVKAVITRLVQMLGGFPAANITLFENQSFSSSGYTTTYFGQPVKLVYDGSFPDLGYYIFCNGKNRPYSKSLHDADYLINMPVLKDHSCGTSFNFTLTFKNHMGTLNPGGSLGIHCDKKACLDIMADAVMTTKQRLIVMDGLYAIYNGGPGGAPQDTPKKIFISQDPVTNDYQGRKILNDLRVLHGLSKKSGSYIEEAAASPYEIGIADPAKMTIITINLPVELKSFNGMIEGDSIKLQWSTVKETNNAGFAVERNLDGQSDWMQVGFVTGNGTTALMNEYQFTETLDSKLRKRPSLFYRLKQIDIDGSYEYSFVIEVQINPESASWMLEQNYPNPFNTTTQASVYLPRSAKVYAEVLDSNGARVEVLHNALMNAGSHYIKWDGSPHATGIYTLRTTAEEITREIKMILLK